MGKETVTQLPKVLRIPGKINPKRNTPRHIVIKQTKIKDKTNKGKINKQNGIMRVTVSGFLGKNMFRECKDSRNVN